MKARLTRNSLKSGQVARDYIRLATGNNNCSASGVLPPAHLAHEVLESFEDQDRSVPADPVVPIKPLVKVMTESLQGMPSLVLDDKGRVEGAGLYRGLKVRLHGIPNRKFIISDIFWDGGEARVREIGTNIEYLLPWDCLEIAEEQKI